MKLVEMRLQQLSYSSSSIDVVQSSVRPSDFLETVDVNLSVVILAVLIQRKEGNVLFVV